VEGNCRFPLEAGKTYQFLRRWAVSGADARRRNSEGFSRRGRQAFPAHEQRVKTIQIDTDLLPLLSMGAYAINVSNQRTLARFVR